MSNNLQPGPISYERSGLTRGMTLGGCLGRIGLLAGVGGAGLGILVAILAVFFPNTLSGAVARLAGIPLPQTMPITGQASAWNPIAAYASVEGFAAAKAQLISFSATNVRSDGTLDLNANYSPAPQVEFRFVHEIPRPTNAPPVGAGSTGRGPWYEPVTITVYHPGERRSFYYSGGGVSADMDYINEGMERETATPTTTLPGVIVEAPKCALADLWKTAQAHDAPSDAVAMISYDANGYAFVISALHVYLNFDRDCQLTN